MSCFLRNNPYTGNTSSYKPLLFDHLLMKITFGKEKFDFTPTMDYETFTSANEDYYFIQYEMAIEWEPQLQYAVRDWDTDAMREWVEESKEEVFDLMAELYREYLSINF